MCPRRRRWKDSNSRSGSCDAAGRKSHHARFASLQDLRDTGGRHDFGRFHDGDGISELACFNPFAGARHDDFIQRCGRLGHHDVEKKGLARDNIHLAFGRRVPNEPDADRAFADRDIGQTEAADLIGQCAERGTVDADLHPGQRPIGCSLSDPSFDDSALLREQRGGHYECEQCHERAARSPDKQLHRLSSNSECWYVPTAVDLHPCAIRR